MELYYLSNCGIYLTHADQGILIDGLYKGFEGFDFLSETVRDDILNRQGLFWNLTALFYTHCHEDHYDPELNDALREKFPDLLFHTPDSPLQDEHRDFLKFSAITTSHLAPNPGNFPHQVLFLSFFGKNFFFSGDSDPISIRRDIQTEFYSDFSGDCTAFVNPFFLFLPPARKLLAELDFSHTFIYHLPTGGTDPYRYREVLERGLKKKGNLSVCPLTKANPKKAILTL